MNCIDVFNLSIDEILERLRIREDRLFVFQHIPKTAGSSIHRELEKLPNNFHWLADDSKFHSWQSFIDQHKVAPMSVLRGHMKSVHLDDLECRGMDYQAVAFLREPVAQTISHFRYCHSDRCPESPTLRKTYPDINAFVTRYLKPNFSTTYMVGKCYSAEEAIEKIVRRFAFVGLTEYYNTSMYLLMKAWGLPFSVTPKVNVTRSKHRIEDLLTDSFRQQIEDLNQIDIEVFNFFASRFGILSEKIVEHQVCQLDSSHQLRFVA